MNTIFSPREFQQNLEKLRNELAMAQGRIEFISNYIENDQKDKRFIIFVFMTISSILLIATIVIFFQIHLLRREMDDRFNAADQRVERIEKRLDALNEKSREQGR